MSFVILSVSMAALLCSIYLERGDHQVVLCCGCVADGSSQESGTRYHIESSAAAAAEDLVRARRAEQIVFFKGAFVYLGHM